MLSRIGTQLDVLIDLAPRIEKRNPSSSHESTVVERNRLGDRDLSNGHLFNLE